MTVGEYSFTRRDSDFESEGLQCSGWLYVPDGVAHPPVLVMGHGLAAQKDFGLAAFAERFVRELGIAVFVFDYRNFGGSQGEPRNLVNPWRHGRDWDNAIRHVRRLPEVDGTRVALWGSSLGGGHVICAAARHPDLSAAIAQVPFVSGASSLSQRSAGDIITATVHGLRDLARKLTWRRPHTVPVIAAPGTFAAMNSAESYPGYSAIVPAGTAWRNEMPARGLLLLTLYRPTAERNIQLELAFLREHLPAIKPSLPPAPDPSRPVDGR